MYRKNRMWRDLLIRFGKKPLILAVALVVTISATLGGSLAWLTATTSVITNTFTIGDIKIDLTESDDGDGDPNNNSYEITLGKPIDKDPKVTVYGGSKDCWLFIKIDVSANFSPLLSYTAAAGWTELGDSYPGVYYRAVNESSSAQEFAVLAGNKVNVAPSSPEIDKILKEIMETDNYPYMKIRAYAIQRDATIDKIDNAEEAWGLIPAEEKVLISAPASGANATNDPSSEGGVSVAPTASAEPQNYAERKAAQAEEGWLAFAAP